MQLKPAVPTKNSGKSRRRLLIGIGIVVVALVASAVSLTFALTPNTPDLPSGGEDYSAAATTSVDYAAGAVPGTSGAPAGLARHRPADRVIYSTEAPLGPSTPATTAGSSVTGEPVAQAESAAQGGPVDLYASAEANSPAGPVAAAASGDTGTNDSSTTNTIPRVTKVENAATSWADLRGVPPTTTTTLQTVQGYEVVEDVTGMTGNPAVNAFTTGGLDVFVLTAAQIWWGVIWYGDIWPEGAEAAMPAEGDKFGDDSWGGKESGKNGQMVTTAAGSGPASVAWSSGYTDVFVRGADDTLFHRRGTTTWHAWESLGGLLSSDPAVASRAPGLLDVFARGPFNQLWHISFDGAKWSDWVNLGGDLASEPAAVAMDSGRIDVFARARDGGLLQLTWSDSTGWSSWENLGGQMTSGPAVCSLHPGRLDVFARGPGGTLWQRTWMLDKCAGFRKWLPWKDLGGSPIASSPDAAAWGGNRIDVFVRGTDYKTGNDNALWHRWWNGSVWLP